MAKKKVGIVGRKQLQFPFHEEKKKNGVFASFDDSGRLVELYRLVEGRRLGRNLSVDYVNRVAHTWDIEVFPDPRTNWSPDDPDLSLERFIESVVDKFEREGPTTEFRCSFCNAKQTEVKKLVMGPHFVSICNNCVEMATEVVAEELVPEAD